MTTQSRHAFGFVLLTVLIDMIGFGIIIPVLPALIEDVGHMGLGQAALIGGWMFAAFSISQFLFAPLVGNLSDRFGRRPLLLLAIFGLGLDYLLSAWAPSLFWLFIGRILAGICGSSWVIANAYVADVTSPENRAKAFGYMGAAFGAGFVIGPAIGGILGEFGPRVPFWAAAGLSFANFAYGWFVLPESLPRSKRRVFDWRRANPLGIFNIFRAYPGVVPMCTLIFLYVFASAVYPATWSFWGIAKFGWTEAMVGLTMAVFGLVMAAFQGILVGPAVRIWGETRVALIGLSCAVIAAYGYGFAGSMTAIILLTLIHGPEGFVHPMVMARLSKAVPEDAQGELQGGISAITNIAMLTGTLTFTQLFAYFMSENSIWQTPDAGFLLAGVLLTITLLLFAILNHRQKL